MQAKPGDRVVIEGLKVGGVRRRGEIIEVLQGTSGEHFRVRWERDAHESIFYPGPGAFIEPAPASKATKAAKVTKAAKAKGTSEAKGAKAAGAGREGGPRAGKKAGAPKRST